MGYLKDGRWIETEDYGDRLQRDINEETMKLYRERYGGRNPDTLSSWELDQIKTKAGQNVMKKRGGG